MSDTGLLPPSINNNATTNSAYYMRMWGSEKVKETPAKAQFSKFCLLRRTI